MSQNVVKTFTEVLCTIYSIILKYRKTQKITITHNLKLCFFPLYQKKLLKFSPISKARLKIFWGWCNRYTKICFLFHLWDVEKICKYSKTHFSLCETVNAESVTFKYLKSISADDFYFFRNIPFICNYLASNHVQRK